MQVKKVCAACGSEDVFVDASAVWDEEQQCWELESDHVDTNSAFCRDCNDSCEIKEEACVQLVETLKTEFHPHDWINHAENIPADPVTLVGSEIRNQREQGTSFTVDSIPMMSAEEWKEFYLSKPNLSDLERKVMGQMEADEKFNHIEDMIKNDTIKYGGTVSGRFSTSKPNPYAGTNARILVEDDPTYGSAWMTPPKLEVETTDSYLDRHCVDQHDALIHAKLSADKVLMRTDRQMMFPNFHADLSKGRPLVSNSMDVEKAQDRVILRRHLRKHFAKAIKNINLSKLDLKTLKAMVNSLKDIDIGNRTDG